MVEVKLSKCHCGKCQTEFLVEWDLEVASVSEHSMGDRIEYESKMEYTCPGCGNTIGATLYVSEYPVGELEYEKVKEMTDSESTGKSYIEDPVIAFFDL